LTKNSFISYCKKITIAGWSSPVARRAHNPKARGSNPLPATNKIKGLQRCKPFFIAKRKARRGRNPQTGAEINIKAAKVPKLRAGKALKEAVN
jgi:hypothetical protein